MGNTTRQSEPTGFQSALVERARAGDRQAFDRLAAQCRPLLFAIAFLRTSHKEEAEDLVQEILTRAWQKLPTLADPAAFLPWLKTIMANACIGWYRRARPAPLSLNEESGLLTAMEGLPLLHLLAQDRQRELRQALLTLPKANRLALLMHVWGDASYEEIALFTGVPVSTVDGRIYRAKRRLRRLLSDSGAEFLGERRRPQQSLPAHAELAPPSWRTKMPTTTTAMDWEQPMALIAFTRRFSFLLDAGVPLLRSLEMMETLPAPYGEASRHIRAAVAGGNIPSRAMAERPDLFSPIYIGMIHAGEVGGILEEAVQSLKEALAREWNLAMRASAQAAPLFLLSSTGQALPEHWAEMSAYQQTVTLSLFFEAFGILLQSGVPLPLAIKTVAALLPSVPQESWKRLCERIQPEGPPLSALMQQLGIFPGFTLEMVRFGEESGTLDSLLHRLAEALEEDLEYQFGPTTS